MGVGGVAKVLSWQGEARPGMRPERNKVGNTFLIFCLFFGLHEVSKNTCIVAAFSYHELHLNLVLYHYMITEIYENI